MVRRHPHLAAHFYDQFEEPVQIIPADPVIAWQEVELDGDDVAARRRLELQAAFLDTHPSFGLVGTWTKLIDREGNPTGVSWRSKIPSEKITVTYEGVDNAQNYDPS